MSLIKNRVTAAYFIAPGQFAPQQEPIREELFSAERMEQLASHLATEQSRVAKTAAGPNLTTQAFENRRILLQCYQTISESAQAQLAATPSVEWLLDNFHVVEDQLRELDDNLTVQSSRALPKLIDGPFAGYPRIFGVVRTFIAHTDCRFDPALLTRFLQAYQRTEVLTIKELWAVPMCLRFFMVDNLRRLSVRVIALQNARQKADAFADELLAYRNQPPDIVDAAFRKMPVPDFSPAFAVQLIHRLRYQDVSLRHLNELLREQSMDGDAIVQAEHVIQSADNLSVRNIVVSMKTMSIFDWQGWFEGVSLVDECLRRSPGFELMDFATRDRYRHALEEIADGSNRSELDIAGTVIAKTSATNNSACAAADRMSDVGYLLIAGGRRGFEQEIGFRPSLRQRFMRVCVSHAHAAYFGGIGLMTLLLLAAPLGISARAGLGWGQLVLLALLGAFPASDMAVGILNKFVSKLFGPRYLPRLQLEHGVPASMRTCVVIPTLLTSDASIAEQIEQLEAHYLSNAKGDVHFALLSDWLDADHEVEATDKQLFDLAQAGIATLNTRYGALPGGEQRFFLFHRKRLWNPRQKKWMGWERKRGKLHEFNRLLRGAQDTSFITAEQNVPSLPPDVRYVITLDDDTKLPIGVVCRLVGTAAHPLNWPRQDSETQRVVEGYGIIQPRITPTLPLARESSLYQRMFSGPGGIDPYAGAVSDVYQDLFGEGNYTGKGLYDVDAFEAALAGRVPENAILSHDLFEGTYARCGLISDIELFEDFPSHSEVAASRIHRWTRGDWQLLPWMIWPKSRSVPALGRAKMADNLRRSLSAPASLFLLLGSLTMLHAPYMVWLGFVLLSFAFPVLLSIYDELLPRHRGISKPHHVRVLATDMMRAVGHAALALTLLAHHAWLMMDAIARTLFRLFSHRRLLEWVTTAQVHNAANFSFGNFLWPLRGATFVAIGSTAIILLFNPGAILAAAPFIILWWGSPIFARLISLPPREVSGQPLQPHEINQLRLHARRIWHFFSTFVGAEDHWLPPDNFQEDPHPVVAHRSSPTNFGLYLLSVIAARDFGWIGILDMADRLESTLKTLLSLPRYRGHFYNWYDTRDLRPLDPQYISSVDSGNLAGHLLALSQGCEELSRRAIFSPIDLIGVRDSVMLLKRALAEGKSDLRTPTVSIKQLREIINDVDLLLELNATNAKDWRELAPELESKANTLIDAVQALVRESNDPAMSEIQAWANAVHADIHSHTRDLELFPSLDFSGSHAGTESAELQQLLQSGRHAQLTLCDTPQYCRAVIAALQGEKAWTNDDSTDIDRTVLNLQHTAEASEQLLTRLGEIRTQAQLLFNEMDFKFLFDTECGLFSIGYRAADAALDSSHYDLLASEARLTSFIAVAKGDVPATHWLRLGRPLMAIEKAAVLLSWSGSMFEYLMPSLIMYTPRHSLLNQTCRLSIERQVAYGSKCSVPWGISESAFNVRDRAYTYQYRAFGVPGLGLKRGLEDDLVIAPYATALAAMYDSRAAITNMNRLETIGARGPYGFFEAVDFTKVRLPESDQAAMIRAYMAHHQAMSLIALLNVLQDGIMRHRFHREPIVKAAELLLQERTPREVPIRAKRMGLAREVMVREPVGFASRHFHSARLPIPSSHLLSNGQYAVMVTAAGSGYSQWGELAVTRWREDVTCDDWGSYLFIRDVMTGEVWSATYQPIGGEPAKYQAVFLEDRARIERREGTLSTVLEILVSPEDNAEIRHLSITNSGSRDREIEITSYSEVVLAPPASDMAHPAFSNLFVQTEYLPEARGLLASRRPRKPGENRIWAAHVIATDTVGAIGYETDRARFLGRGHTVRDPAAVMDDRPLSNTVGPVLDPVFSLRTRLRVAPGATVHATFSTIVATSREAIVSLADKYHDSATFERISTLAWSQAQVQLHYLGITHDEAHLFQYLANRVLFADPLRSAGEAMKRNQLNVRALWRHGISGDRPIVLFRIDDPEEHGVFLQLLRAHEYWRFKRLAVDLVVLNEKKSSYSQNLQEFLEHLVRTCKTVGDATVQGAVFILRADLLTTEEVEQLQCAARVTLYGKQGSLAEQVLRMRRTKPMPHSPPRPATRRIALDDRAPAKLPLEFFNGLGGYAKDGREYVTVLTNGQRTPAPWLNVISNGEFGFQVSESGSGYTWSENSRENQLTPWSNDPVSDPAGEAFFLRDEESGELWTPTALPIRVESTTYIACHGQGYTRFESTTHGIATDLIQFVSWNDPVKLSVCTIENRSSQPREISLTAYLEWVLGASKATSSAYVVTEIDAGTGAMLAHNAWNAEFGERYAFADLCGQQTAWSADRTEFLGRNGGVGQPAGLAPGMALSNRVGATMDPCCAMQTTFKLMPRERKQFTFLLGQAANKQASLELIKRYRELNPMSLLDDVSQQWDAILGKIQIETPERAMDIVLNRWLLYQSLTCRMWARSAFYQAGGAYGFRDQLQDCMALVVTRPDLVRAHLLRAAARQFVEGDVQHWWHPPTGRGVRTHCSDDRLWLPYVVAHYISVTGDNAVLSEMVSFLDGPLLAEGQEDSYFEPKNAEHQGTLFEHCARAIDCSMTVGAHGLPLMGNGDWNDGMNLVGHEGRGESVWLGWFLHAAITGFAPYCAQFDEQDRGKRWLRHTEEVHQALERNAWDGSWYLRAFFDDGTPLGTSSAAECRIDSLAQSWSAITGIGNPDRARRAMQSVYECLVRTGDDLILLFTPPFDKTPLEPGYIKGYLPGVRENGGQYTHAAVWCAIAYCSIGDGDKAGELFDILNPVNHSCTRAGAHAYKVEPYVIAADIYAESPHVRRGGWTWYTGAAGWLYRAQTEWLLGVRIQAGNLKIDPCIPRHWRNYEVNYRHGGATYEINVANPNGVMRGVASLTLDRQVLPQGQSAITLVDDGKRHRVEVVLG